MKKLRITLEGKAYEVIVEVLEDDKASPSSAGVAKSTPVSPANTGTTEPKKLAANQQELESPVVGSVLALKVKVGDSVKVGQDLILLDSMGMETPITSPFIGKVIALNLNVGQMVQKGQLLLTMET